MRPMIPAIVPAALALALAACGNSQPPAPAAEPPVATAPAEVPPPAPVEESSVVEAFRAMGNEPFWTVEVNGTTLRYTTPDNTDGIVLQATRQAYAKGVEFTGTHEGKPFTLNIGGDSCPDSMSDQTHEFTATFDFNGETLRGCADRGS